MLCVFFDCDASCLILLNATDKYKNRRNITWYVFAIVRGGKATLWWWKPGHVQLTSWWVSFYLGVLHEEKCPHLYSLYFCPYGETILSLPLKSTSHVNKVGLLWVSPKSLIVFSFRGILVTLYFTVHWQEAASCTLYQIRQKLDVCCLFDIKWP